MKPIRLLLVTLCASSFITLSALASDPTGTWKFKTETANGKSMESTLILKRENNQLSGSIDNRAGEADISRARFADDQVSFTVVRTFRKQTFTVNYEGKLAGDTIKGTIQTTGRGKETGVD